MKAITICQPYAEMIVRGEKTCENRTWDTKHRGLIYIHAGKSREWWGSADARRYPNAAFGAVVAIAELVAVLHINSPLLREWTDSMNEVQRHHVNGPFCWILDKVDAIGPRPWRGAQGLFDIDDRKLDEVANQCIGVKP